MNSHSQPPHTAKKIREKREHGFIEDTTNNERKREPVGLSPWNGQCQLGFRLGSRMRQPHSCPIRFSYEQTRTQTRPTLPLT
jgi:hypothetical protein